MNLVNLWKNMRSSVEVFSLVLIIANNSLQTLNGCKATFEMWGSSILLWLSLSWGLSSRAKRPDANPRRAQAIMIIVIMLLNVIYLYGDRLAWTHRHPTLSGLISLNLFILAFYYLVNPKENGRKITISIS